MFVFVFSLSHLSPAFCVLGFGYVLISDVFLAEIFFKWISKDITVKWNEVPKRRKFELKTAPLFTRLNIHKRISAKEKCVNFKDRNIFILSEKNNLYLKQDEGNDNILNIRGIIP